MIGSLSTADSSCYYLQSTYLVVDLRLELHSRLDDIDGRQRTVSDSALRESDVSITLVKGKAKMKRLTPTAPARANRAKRPTPFADSDDSTTAWTGKALATLASLPVMPLSCEKRGDWKAIVSFILLAIFFCSTKKAG